MHGLRVCLCSMMIAGATLGWGGSAFAGDHIEVLQANLEPQEDGWGIDADFRLDLKPRLDEALQHGLALFFVVDFELTRSRWYWFDEKSSNSQLTYRISYHALTRQYRLSNGPLQLSFHSLEEAIGFMTHIRNWRVMDRGGLQRGTYQAAVRMRLDTSQLPKPMVIAAITSREWTMDSDWYRFAVTGDSGR